MDGKCRIGSAEMEGSLTRDVVMWPEYSVNDFVYQPDCVEKLVLCEFAIHYERVAMSFQRMKKVNQSGMPILQDGNFAFQDSHPIRWFCCVKKSKTTKIPNLSTPKGMICDFEELDDVWSFEEQSC